jgi:hypothetical protein
MQTGNNITNETSDRQGMWYTRRGIEETAKRCVAHFIPDQEIERSWYFMSVNWRTGGISS